MKLSQKSILFLIIISFALSACSGLKTPAGGGGTPPPGGGGGTPPPGGGGSPTGPFTIGGSGLGLQGTGPFLQDNGGADPTPTPSRPGRLPPSNPIPHGGPYNPTTKKNPSSPTQHPRPPHCH